MRSRGKCDLCGNPPSTPLRHGTIRGVDTAEIVLDYLRVLAWPLVVTVALLAFRASIRNVLARLSAFEGFGVKASLEKVVHDAQRVTGSPEGRRPRGDSSLATMAVGGEAHIFSLRSYSETRGPAEAFRDGNIVLADLSPASDADAKRMVDFLAGTVFNARGTIERWDDKVFLLTPPGGPRPKRDFPPVPAAR